MKRLDLLYEESESLYERPWFPHQLCGYANMIGGTTHREMRRFGHESRGLRTIYLFTDGFNRQMIRTSFCSAMYYLVYILAMYYPASLQVLYLLSDLVSFFPISGCLAP